MLKNKIQDNLIEALKKKNSNVLITLRFFTAAIKNKEIEKKTDLSEEEIITIIRKQIKELKESNEMFAKGNRQDLIIENEERIKILSQYLPVEISDDELKSEIEKIINDNREIYNKNKKTLIGICVNKLKIKADPQRIITLLNTFE